MPTLDHYHSKKQHGSGLVRGVLCNCCNRFVGAVENNIVRNGIDLSDAPDVIRNLANYIENYREPFLHPTERPKKPKLTKASYNKLIKAIDGKQQVPKYSGNLSKRLQQLYDKYEIEPEFYVKK